MDDTGQSSADLSELVTAARGGEPEAMRVLVEEIWPTAFRTALSVLRDRGRAEDAAQEAAALMVASLRSLRDPGAFPAWFRRIVLREAYRQALRAGREVPMSEPVAESSVPAPAAADPDLRQAVLSLPPAYRIPVLLRYVQGLSSAEIGRALGVPAGTVRFRLAVARRRLRDALERPPETLGSRLPVQSPVEGALR